MSEKDHYKYGFDRKIDTRIPKLQGRIRVLKSVLREAHDELTNHGHEELSECDCKIARELNFE